MALDVGVMGLQRELDLEDDEYLRKVVQVGCCCLPCIHCSNWAWFVEEILAFCTRLRYTHCREFNAFVLPNNAKFYTVRNIQYYLYIN